ncbi:MAG: hypothetical protein QXH64_03420 [Nitrososphaeria archaeon]
MNRRLTDHCSTLLFTPTENCTKNLLKEGLEKTKIIISCVYLYKSIADETYGGIHEVKYRVRLLL